MTKCNSVLVAAFSSALAFTVLPAAAQERPWPDRPVRLIVGQGAGSAQDIAARMFGEQLSMRWGQPIVIENKPGADGISRHQRLRRRS